MVKCAGPIAVQAPRPGLAARRTRTSLRGRVGPAPRPHARRSAAMLSYGIGVTFRALCLLKRIEVTKDAECGVYPGVSERARANVCSIQRPAVHAAASHERASNIARPAHAIATASAWS